MDNSLSYIADAWHFFKTRIITIFILIAPIVVLGNIAFVGIVNYAEDVKYIEFFALIPSLLVFPIYQCVFILYLFSSITDKVTPKDQYYKIAFRLWFTLACLYVSLAVAVIIGFLLLIVPALIIMVRMSFVEFYCIMHNKNPIEAIKLSWQSTEKYQWTLFLGGALLWLITSIAFFSLKKILTVMDLWNSISIVIYHSAESFFAVIFTVFSFRIFTLLSDDSDN